jgi:hypothetical protein
MDATQTRRDRAELLATVLLSVAALTIAWSTYQSSQWRGEQAVYNSRASTSRIKSSEASTRAGQLTQIDIATFTQWVNAYVAGNTQLAEFYRQRFRDEFKPAFEAWFATSPLTNPDAPATPFAMSQYQVAPAKEATRLDTLADAQAGASSSANDRSDRYTLAVVLVASSLFFAGISTKMRSSRQTEVLLGLGGAVFLVAVVLLATFPVKLVT